MLNTPNPSVRTVPPPAIRPGGAPASGVLRLSGGPSSLAAHSRPAASAAAPDLFEPALMLCRALPVGADGAPPEWLLLVPAGESQGRDGRTFRLSDPTPALETYRSEDADIPVDWEHSTHKQAPLGLPAPAAAWVVELQSREGAIWGRVEWTAAGAEAVRSRAYRYYSPAYYLDPTGAVVGIPSVGLTSKPNLRLPAMNQTQPGLAGAQEVEIEITVGPADPESCAMSVPAPLAAELALPADCTVDAAVAAVAALKQAHSVALNRAAVPDLTLYVPRGDLDAALNRASTAETLLRDAQTAQTTKEIDALIADGLAATRITPATVDYHRAQAASPGGIERLRGYLGAAPAVLTAATRIGPAPAGTLELNSQQALIAAAFGNTPETLAKYAGAAQ